MVRVVRDPEPVEAEAVDETPTSSEQSDGALDDIVARGFLANDFERIPFISSSAEVYTAEMNQLKEQLNQALDRTLVKQRKGYGQGDAKVLDYLEWHTVVRQLNLIIGVNRWSTDVEEVKTYGEDTATGVPRAVSVTMKLTIDWPDRGSTYYTNVGFAVTNTRKDGSVTWDGFEMAYKGAAHDALKRCATALGDQFGLSLYAKEEESKKEKVTSAVEAVDAAAPAAASAASGAASGTKPQWQKNVKAEDYDADADYTAYCEDCEKPIRGYVHKQTGRVYTTDDLVNISKKTAGGRVLCYNCRTSTR